MKRRHMIMDIASELILQLIEYHIDLDYGKAQEVADKILTRQEKEGMLPPGYLKPIPFINGKQYPLIPGDFQNQQGIWCHPDQHEWESDTE